MASAACPTQLVQARRRGGRMDQERPDTFGVEAGPAHLSPCLADCAGCQVVANAGAALLCVAIADAPVTRERIEERIPGKLRAVFASIAECDDQVERDR